MVRNDVSSEFEWTESDFKKIQELIYQRAGISLHDGKHAMVYSRLTRRLREKGFTSFGTYLTWLNTHQGEEWQEFINALTTNLTSFFRETHHFEALSTYLKARTVVEPVQIWCSAASTGEEPYSIFMTATQSLPPDREFRLVASDIDSRVLETAKKGIYRDDQLHAVQEASRKRFFLRGTSGNTGMVRFKPCYSSLIEFVNVNLVRDDWPFRQKFDFVFCRNVMIYFDAATQRSVLENIHRVMRPGAVLFVGHSENFTESRDLFALRGKTVYERV